MKRQNQIDLDFTSLLDIIMVILFFFIIFTKIETDDTKKEYKNMQEKLKNQQIELENKISEADEMLKSAQEMLSEAEMAKEKNITLRIFLNMSDVKGEWKLSIVKEDEIISEIFKSDVEDMYEQLNNVIEYQKTKNIVVEFIYNANENGTTSAYLHIDKLFKKLKKEYSNLWICETDISILESGEY